MAQHGQVLRLRARRLDRRRYGRTDTASTEAAPSGLRLAGSRPAHRPIEPFDENSSGCVRVGR
jgi:hypothetical protein